MQNLLDDHRLTYLYEAIRLGSVRAAADMLVVNASVVSRQIAQLEKDLGVLLLERLSRGVRATEAGALLAERHRQWSADREDTIAKLREIQGLQRGHIDIVLGEGFVSDLMSGPLNRFWQRYPSLTMSFDLAGTNEVIAAVAEDRCHIGLVYNPKPDPRLHVWAAIRQPICLIARPDHPLARAENKLRLVDAAQHPLGLMHASYGTRQVVALAEAAEKIGIAPKLTTSSINVLRHFVKAGMGVTLLPAFAIAADILDKSLVALPIDNPLLASTEAQLITRQGRELPNAASQLLRFLIGQMRAFRDRAA